MKMLAVFALSFLAGSASAQTVEDAHVKHMGLLADAALNAQYRIAMAAMIQADKARDADLKTGIAQPDSRPTFQAALITAERAWLVFRDAHCETVGLAFRGGVYEDEADGKCANTLTRRRTVELKALADSMNR
jgi:uncharacterized protein YecT (DUF1311 family)